MTPLASAHAVDGPSQSYGFAFVPQQSARDLVRQWGPILSYLGEKTGYAFRFQTAANIPAFEERMGQGTYDFAYCNPLHQVFFHADPGYHAFARQANKRIRGVIVVRSDSPLLALAAREGEGAALRALENEAIAFPAPAAFAASVLPRGFLAQQGIAITPSYVGSHDSVYRGVASGRFLAGGGIERTLVTVAPEIREQLTVLYTTKGFTPHAFTAHPRVPAQVVEALRTAFVAMADDPQGRDLLAAVGFKAGVEAATDADWDDVRALGFSALPK